MRQVGLCAFFLLIGLLFGWQLRRSPEPAPSVRPVSPTEQDQTTAPVPPVEPGSDPSAELERLRRRIAELEGSLAKTRPIRLAEETDDPDLAGVRIIVLDEGGRPRPGVEVGVTVYVRPYRLSARAPGHLRKDLGIVEVLADKEQRMDLELDPAATLVFRILDREGNPVIGTVGVRIRPGLSGKRLPAGEGGVLKVDELPPGEAEITIHAAGAGQAVVTSNLVLGENALTVRLE